MELTDGGAAAEARSDCLPRLTGQQCQELERFFTESPQPDFVLFQEFVESCPALANLEKKHLKAWFEQWRWKRSLSPLIHRNAELQAQTQSLLIRNSQLRNQTLFLNLENQRLKEQLQLQLQQKHPGNSEASSTASGCHPAINDKV